MPEHYGLGERLGFDRSRVDHEANLFRDGAIANGRVYVNWLAAFRTWLARAKTYDDRDAQRRPHRPQDDAERPLEGDTWPEATLTPPHVWTPPPERARRELTPAEISRREHLRSLSPRELELEVERVRAVAGCYGHRVLARSAS